MTDKKITPSNPENVPADQAVDETLPQLVERKTARQASRLTKREAKHGSWN